MAISSSGSITMSDIQTEFGGSNPISLSEYYAGGSNVGANISGNNGTIPSSGAIDMGDFRGSSNVVYPNATGGTITTSGNNRIHQFNSSGTFSVQSVGNQNTTLEWLIIAGGAGRWSTRWWWRRSWRSSKCKWCIFQCNKLHNHSWSWRFWSQTN